MKGKPFMKKSLKRASRIACIACAIALILPSAVSAANQLEPVGTTDVEVPGVETTSTDYPDSKTPLKLNEKKSYPFDGDDHVPVDTVGIKLYFDGDVTAESVRNTNNAEGVFKFSGTKNEKITTKAYFDKKDPTYILVTATKTKDGAAISLNQASKYKLTISGSLIDTNGRSLGEDRVINFTTVDTSQNSKVYMLLMVLMVVAMFGMNFLSKKRKARAKEAVENTKAINPYKLAKEKGITVQEAMAVVEKDKRKREKLLKSAGIDPKTIAPPKDDGPKGHKVKGARPVSAGGSTYKTGNKAIAEKRAKDAAAKKAKEAAAKRAAGTTNPKKKGKGGKKKKK
jgi:hypothetical protein